MIYASSKDAIKKKFTGNVVEVCFLLYLCPFVRLSRDVLFVFRYQARVAGERSGRHQRPKDPCRKARRRIGGLPRGVAPV